MDEQASYTYGKHAFKITLLPGGKIELLLVFDNEADAETAFHSMVEAANNGTLRLTFLNTERTLEH